MPETEEIPVVINVQKLKKALGQDSFDFSCTQCGKCCSGPGSVYFSGPELKEIFSYLKLNQKDQKILKAKLIQYEDNGYFVHDTDTSCILLDEEKGCTVYPARPLQCKTYPFWPSQFANKAAVAELKSDCPGSLKGTGDEFSLLQTVRKINKTQKEFEAHQIKATEYL